MWVVKLGGSLNQDASLPQWLDLLAELGGGRVIVVPGGGAFADQVRDAQSQWQFDDLAAHNMAVLGMAQTALMLQGLCPALQAAAGEQPLRRVLQGGQTALWLPLDLLRSRPDELTNWGVSSDSLALWLAQRLHAERLLVVKSCAIDARRSLTQLGETGVLDAEFAQRARQAAFPIDLLHKGELARARALLLDESLSCRPFAG
ncbi:MAG: aspartate kinase [Methylibium sp.]|uniref:amino acid kinase family protein n=1 Tax=Methylibium sp. TaxID=2067992 RepID=UPI00274D5033|nr:aspartate kinase [Methylibium sp.]